MEDMWDEMDQKKKEGTDPLAEPWQAGTLITEREDKLKEWSEDLNAQPHRVIKTKGLDALAKKESLSRPRVDYPLSLPKGSVGGKHRMAAASGCLEAVSARACGGTEEKTEHLTRRVGFRASMEYDLQTGGGGNSHYDLRLMGTGRKMCILGQSEATT